MYIFFDIPVAIATSAGMAAIALRSGGGAGLVKKIATYAGVKSKNLKAGKLSAADLKIYKTLTKYRKRFKNSGVRLEKLRDTKLRGLGAWFDKNFMSHVDMIKSGMKTKPIATNSVVGSLATV